MKTPFTVTVHQTGSWTIESVTRPGEIDLEYLYARVFPPGWKHMRTVGTVGLYTPSLGSMCLWLDDEAMLTGREPNWAATVIARSWSTLDIDQNGPILGPIVLTSGDVDDDDNTVGLTANQLWASLDLLARFSVSHAGVTS